MSPSIRRLILPITLLAITMTIACHHNRPGPAGGVVTIPAGGPLIALPPGSRVAITPTPFPAAVGTAGVVVAVKVTAASGAVIANVPVQLQLLTGSDGVINCVSDAGVNPAGGRFVGTTINTNTDNTGTATVTLKALTAGDEDVLVITTDAGPRQNQQTFSFIPTNP